MTVGENLLADGVCMPGAELTVPAEDLAPLAARVKVLGDPTRMRIVQILAANGSVCACDLEEPLGLSQPTVSHHLRQLTEAGLVVRDKRGTWAFFRVADAEVADLASAVRGLAARS
ncbi:ArsR/SmtB family transcription factor [Demequina aestuarii]|uniref:ArsR/SmtB family transcription factor n=1 Tax=Demequina aestuarii TaxID=327095 RepID=UPI0007802550